MDKNSNKNQITTKDEEVDLGQLFSMIGKMFTDFFNFIGKILKGIFHYLILFFIFLKGHIVKLSIAVLLGGTLGFASDNFIPIKYTYDMIIQPNYRSIDQIYESLEYYNVLIEQKDSITLAEKFYISYREANNLVGFRLISYDTEKEKLMAFDKFIKNTDTLTQKNFSYSIFKNDTESKFDSDKYVFRIVSYDSKLKSFEKSVVDDIKKNKTLQNNRRIKLNILKLDSLATVNSIRRASDLRELYKEVKLSQGSKSKEASSTYIDFSKESKENNDIQLFEIVKKLNDNLIELEKEKERSLNIVNVITTFNPSGKKIGTLFETNMFRWGVFSGCLVLFFIFIKMLNEYLKGYKLKIS